MKNESYSDNLTENGAKSRENLRISNLLKMREEEPLEIGNQQLESELQEAPSFKKGDLKLHQITTSGLASPAEDHLDSMLSLDRHLVGDPVSTFFIRAGSFAMSDLGVFPQDLLIVDRAKVASSGDLIVALLDGVALLRLYQVKGRSCKLLAANCSYKDLTISKSNDFSIWGVVNFTIQNMKTDKLYDQ